MFTRRETLFNSVNIVKEWDMRLVDKTIIPRMPWHDMALCVVNSFFTSQEKKKITFKTIAW